MIHSSTSLIPESQDIGIDKSSCLREANNVKYNCDDYSW